jgi:hypothetical protein
MKSVSGDKPYWTSAHNNDLETAPHTRISVIREPVDIHTKNVLEENEMPQLVSSFRILIRYGKAEVSRTIAFSSRQRFVRNQSRVNSE